MANDAKPAEAAAKAATPLALWLVLLAAAGAFALTMGTRQTMGLFLSALNTSTGLGIGSISLALVGPDAAFCRRLLYATRGLAILVFLFAPKTPTVVLIFAAVMGVTFLSTVPPTVGLVAKMFGTANMAMLFGIVMLAHQIGGFFGAYLGGSVFQATGSYDWVWYIDIVLALGATLVHLPIREARLARTAVAKTL